MATRNLDLFSRVEDVREARPVALPVQFSLEEIKQHFDDSLNGIKGQYLVADLLIQNGNEVGGKRFGGHKLFWQKDCWISTFTR